MAEQVRQEAEGICVVINPDKTKSVANIIQLQSATVNLPRPDIKHVAKYLGNITDGVGNVAVTWRCLPCFTCFSDFHGTPVIVAALCPGEMIKSFKQTFLSLELQSPKWSSAEIVVKECELRHYETAKWASTVIKGETQKEALRQGFWKLFCYIQGKNDKEMKIEMTVPVTCLVKSDCTDFKVSFFVPFEHQDSPPQPTDPDVLIEEWKGESIFVRSFGGFASPEKYAEEAQALATILNNSGQTFHDDFYYTAGYDSPFKLFNRHNEVWYFKK